AAAVPEEESRSAPAKVAAPAAGDGSATPGPVLRTIPQQVVTGSAATGAFIQLPGLAPRGEAGAAGTPRIEIRDRDAEQRSLGRTGLVTRAPAGRDRYGRPAPAGGGPGNRSGGPPRK